MRPFPLQRRGLWVAGICGLLMAGSIVVTTRPAAPSPRASAPATPPGAPEFVAYPTLDPTFADTTPGENGNPQISDPAEFARLYTSVKDLSTDSSLIVLGQFQDLATVVLPKMDKPPYDPGRRELGFRPTHVLKGQAKTTIQVAQRVSFARSTSPTVTAAGDDTLFRPGDTYILFLTSALPVELRGNAEPFYWVTGAIQGAFRVKDGKVYSRNITGEIPAQVGPRIAGQPLDTFLAIIQATPKAP